MTNSVHSLYNLKPTLESKLEWNTKKKSWVGISKLCHIAKATNKLAKTLRINFFGVLESKEKLTTVREMFHKEKND